MPSRNNLKDKAGAHSHGGVSRGITKKNKDFRNKKEKSKRQPTSDVPPSSSPSSSGAVLDRDMRVLLLGEGNFSFAAALALDWGDDCEKLTATTDAGKATTLALDADAEDSIETVRAFGGSVLYKVDATDLQANEEVVRRATKKGYQRIVFNFPSVPSSIPSHQAVEASQALLRGVLKSVLSSRLLCTVSGELHVTLSRADGASWSLVDIARIAGMCVKSCTPFDASRYQGYEAPEPAGDAVTYVLVEVPPKVSKEELKAQAVAKLAKERPDLRIGPTGQSYKEAWKQRHHARH